VGLRARNPSDMPTEDSEESLERRESSSQRLLRVLSIVETACQHLADQARPLNFESQGGSTQIASVSTARGSRPRSRAAGVQILGDSAFATLTALPSLVSSAQETAIGFQRTVKSAHARLVRAESAVSKLMGTIESQRKEIDQLRASAEQHTQPCARCAALQERIETMEHARSADLEKLERSLRLCRHYAASARSSPPRESPRRGERGLGVSRNCAAVSVSPVEHRPRELSRTPVPVAVASITPRASSSSPDRTKPGAASSGGHRLPTLLSHVALEVPQDKYSASSWPSTAVEVPQDKYSASSWPSTAGEVPQDKYSASSWPSTAGEVPQDKYSASSWPSTAGEVPQDKYSASSWPSTAGEVPQDKYSASSWLARARAATRPSATDSTQRLLQRARVAESTLGSRTPPLEKSDAVFRSPDLEAFRRRLEAIARDGITQRRGVFGSDTDDQQEHDNESDDSDELEEDDYDDEGEHEDGGLDCEDSDGEDDESRDDAFAYEREALSEYRGHPREDHDLDGSDSDEDVQTRRVEGGVAAAFVRRGASKPHASPPNE
jgi:hypothetical protein